MSPKRILFICHGNICRSAAAEMVFRKMAEELGKEELFRIESAATSREDIGKDIDRPMKSALLNRGYPVANTTRFVGDRYQLSERQRLALARTVSPAGVCRISFTGRTSRITTGGLRRSRRQP